MSVVVAYRYRRPEVVAWYNAMLPALFFFFFFYVAFIDVAVVTVTVADAMAPPYPELLEESRRHRALHEFLFPNITYSSLPSLPSGIWESASDYKHRQRQHRQRQLLEFDPDNNNNDNDPDNNNNDNNNDYEDHTATAKINDKDANIQINRQFSMEICRYLDNTECDDIETSFVKMGTKTRTTMQSKHAIRTLVILVAWKDQVERILWISRDQIDRLWNGMGTDPEIIPTGSIANYTQTQAYNTVRFQADVLGWQITDNTEAYYGDGRSGMPKNGDKEPNIKSAFHFLLDKMEAEDFPWADYDSDDDGYIDHVQFLHTGYGAELGGTGE